MALALTPTRGVYRKLDTVENCSWIGNCIQTALVRGSRGGREKVSIEDEILRTTTLDATAASAHVYMQTRHKQKLERKQRYNVLACSLLLLELI